MYGLASPFGRGGGARHIALGVPGARFPIARFLSGHRGRRIRMQAASDGFGSAVIEFASIPTRRGGEWIITDQVNHRHPAWSAEAGFPREYDDENPPVILIFRAGDAVHVRYAMARRIAALVLEFPEFSSPKGVAPASEMLLSEFGVPHKTLVEEFSEVSGIVAVDEFDPTSLEDGRKKVFAAIARRQGQGPFRQRLLSAYSGRCAVSLARTPWVLEAAHITPYLGADTNVLANGLLLRADIHTLFDLGLISVEPRRRVIRISSELNSSEYIAFDQKPLAQPR
jgi:hypothetical protein